MRKLPWSHIKEMFRGQWIELIDYNWDEARALPAWGTVRHFSDKREEVLDAIQTSKSIPGAVVFFVNGATALVRHETRYATL